MKSEEFLHTIVSRLERVSGPDKDGWYTALCPFHDDQRRPNLRLNTNGYRCMACGEKGNLSNLAVTLGIPQAKSMINQASIIATYDYQDENGNLLYQVVRYDPKGFKQRRPNGNGGWTWNLNGVRRVLFKLPDILSSPSHSTVFLPEGEKDVETLRSIGCTATCNPGGAGKLTLEMRGPLKDRHIVIIADKDEPGRRHAQQVAALLYNFAADVKILEMPGESIKDATDWIIAGGTRESLRELVAATPMWAPESEYTVLDNILDFLLRFVVLTPSQAEAITLWIVHTYIFESFEATLYLNIHSAEKRSGKTRLLEVLDLLVNNPWFTGRVSTAALARKIDKEKPTLLLDESDAAFKGDKDYSQTLRGILNSGYRRGGRYSICIGQGANIGYKDLSTFCPKAIAGIGKLPDTIADRSIPIRLRRRAPNERVDKFRRTKIELEASHLRERITNWLSERTIVGSEPAIPEELDDRAADGWEVLLAIADAAGADWPVRARHAAIDLMTGETREDESLGIRLLSDIFLLFTETDRFSSIGLVRDLIKNEETPWGDIAGHPLDTRRLAAILKKYGIKPHSIRIDDKTPKGYLKQDFQDAWNRYLPVKTPITATSATSASGQLQNEHRNYPQQDVENTRDISDDSQSCFIPTVADVADKLPRKDQAEGKPAQWEVEI